MKITIEGSDQEIREVMPDGWLPGLKVSVVVAGKVREFFPVRLKGYRDGNILDLVETVPIKTKQKIKAEEAVKAAEESLKKAREALEVIER